MKLLTRTNLYFLGASMLVFCLGGILFFLLFEQIIDNDIKNKLHERKSYVIDQLVSSDNILLYQQSSDNTVSIIPINTITNLNEVISDTTIIDGYRKPVSFRQISFEINIRHQNFKIQVRRALVERKNLVQGVALLELVLFLAFVAILTLLNNQLSKSIWKPFYRILDTIGTYKLDRAENLTFSRDNISEFNELAETIEKMSKVINAEFINQKQFIENASHEIQTPLAIVRNKMEELLQSSGLSQQQLEKITTASSAATRLSKINEALLILSKIENRQFHEVQNIDIMKLTQRHFENFKELILMKDINARVNFSSHVNVNMNPYLADILIENLITNAIKHNSLPGSISIYNEGEKFIIENSGDKPLIDPTKLFQRFVKSNPVSPSLGLGLPIVKAICETYGFDVEYHYKENLHKISIKFKKS